jgi:hypothetical protein
MSLPSAVFLDTSIFDGQQYNFSSTALASFVPVAKRHGLTLLLPDPTEREILRHIRDRSREASSALEDARRKAPLLAKWKHFPVDRSGLSLTREIFQIAMREWRQFQKSFSVLKLDYTHVNLKQVMRWYESSVPPFREGKKRKEFPDAFAVAIVEAYARANSSVIAVVSEDPDFMHACERYSSLLYFKSLPALTELLLTDATEIELWREIILLDVTEIEAAILEKAELFDYFHDDPEYNVVDSVPQNAFITDVRIVALGSNECTLTFAADLEVEHDLQWLEWGYEGGEEEAQQASILETSAITGTAKVSLDPGTHKITKVRAIDTDSSGIKVTENPTRGL